MIVLKWCLIALSIGLFGTALSIVAHDIYQALKFQKLMGAGESGAAHQVGLRRPLRWRHAVKLLGFACLPLLLGLSIVLVPDGAGGVRVTQFSGVQTGTLYPGIHFVLPLFENVVAYDLRDQTYSTSASEGDKKTPRKTEVLNVQAREGLSIGLAMSVRYRLDPQKLAYIHANLTQPVAEEIVAPIVATAVRDLAPQYVVRDLFATRRDEFRQKAAQAITARLASDGIVVKEVLLRDVHLPAEYAKGLEGLLLKVQESERMIYETQIREKEVRIAELRAEADKARRVKQAEADASARVIAAKAESDAMQYTLPLKQKQIEQSRLEAEARKEATVQNAEAAAQSKVIDSRAEAERRRLLAAADAENMRLTSSANAERLQQEAAVLKQNPMLIQKIIAERLSDKLQIIMVPTDGRNFFAADVLRSAFSAGPAPSDIQEDSAEPRRADSPQGATVARSPSIKNSR